MGITETWLDPTVSSASLAIEDYGLVRCDRGLRSNRSFINGTPRYLQGGGVAFYLHISLEYKVLYMSSIRHISETEYLILEISNRNKKDISRTLLAVVYRRPNGVMLSEFFLTLESYMQSFKNLIVVGDLNIDLLRVSFESNHLSYLLSERALQYVPFGPTHFGCGQPSAIDIAIVDSLQKVNTYFTSNLPIAAGHLAITFDYKLRMPRFLPKTVTYRDFKHCDPDALAQEIDSKLSCSIDRRVGSQNVSELVDVFNNEVSACLNRHAPYVTRTITKPFAEWLTPELKHECKERDRLYKKAKQKNSSSLMTEFRDMRRTLKAKLQKARDSYLAKKIESQKEPALIWRTLEQEGLTTKKSESATNHFSAKELNEHFCKVASAHPPCTPERLEQIVETTPPSTWAEFSFKPLSEYEVLQEFKRTQAKSSGKSPDGLPFKYLDRFINIIITFLVFIFNLSISSNKYPNAWKQAFLIPLLKTLQPLSPADTRPIANLCHLAKVFDKLLTTQMLNYLEKNNLLSPYQFGFRSDHNTQSALLHLTDSIRDGIEQGLVTLVVLFDFKKAFDSFSHEALLTALRKLGFSKNALYLVLSYITGRSQAVIDERQNATNFKNVSSGMPQGSSPGPVFFLALVNSLPNYLRYCKLSYVLFADDLQLFIQCPPNMIASAIGNMNVDISQVSMWAAAQGLSLNASKTKAIIFGSTANLQYISNKFIPSLIVNNQPIAFVSQVKSLGILLTSDLSWNAQISSISSRVHGVLHRLRTRGWLLSQRTKQMLVEALVTPRLDYACLVFNDMPSYLQLKVQRLANAGIRYIYNLRRDSSITPYRLELGWITLASRRLYFLGCTAYSILHKQRPLPLYEKLSQMFRSVRRSARLYHAEIEVPSSRTSAHKNSFYVSAASLMSTLPAQLIALPSLQIFRARLRAILYERDNTSRPC